MHKYCKRHLGLNGPISSDIVTRTYTLNILVSSNLLSSGKVFHCILKSETIALLVKLFSQREEIASSYSETCTWLHNHDIAHDKMSRNTTQQQNDLCGQRQRLRSAWASTQSDQSSLSAWRNLGFLATHKAHSEDYSQDWADVILLVLSCCGSNSVLHYQHQLTQKIYWYYNHYR